MVTFSEAKKFFGKRVRLLDVEGKEWIGKLTSSYDYENDKEYITINPENLKLICEFDEEHIISIEVIE